MLCKLNFLWDWSIVTQKSVFFGIFFLPDSLILIGTNQIRKTDLIPAKSIWILPWTVVISSISYNLHEPELFNNWVELGAQVYIKKDYININFYDAYVLLFEKFLSTQDFVHRIYSLSGCHWKLIAKKKIRMKNMFARIFFSSSLSFIKFIWYDSGFYPPNFFYFLLLCEPLSEKKKLSVYCQG